MTRKDSEKDSDRPHYYSQFWLDVAAGRRIIGVPKSEDETAEPEPFEPEPATPIRRGGRSALYGDSSDARADGHEERIVHPSAEPLITPEEFIEAEPEEIDLDASDADTPDILEEVVDDMDIPDMDLSPAAEENEEEEDLVEEEDEENTGEEEEEDEEDLGWGGPRGRKRNKPVRPKLPPKKAPRREPRRGY